MTYVEMANALAGLPVAVKLERHARGLSLRAAAAQIGCANSTLAEFENGVHDVGRLLAVRMMRWLGTPR